MKNRAMHRTPALLLLIAMLASCGEGAASTDTTASADTADTTTAVETDALEARQSIDDELGKYDFGGYEFRIATSNSCTVDYVAEESTGEVVNDAIFARNSKIEERFNCKIKVISDTHHRETSIFTNSISAGDDAIDLICWQTMVLGGYVTNDYFMNWYEIPKVNFDKPWWPTSNVENLTYGGYCPMAIGDMLISAVANTYCVYYNKSKGLDYKLPNLFEVVNDGKWTLDYLVSTTKDVYQDLNGNNELDETDFYGFVSDTQSNVCTYLWAFDNPIFRKNSKGELEFSMNLEKTSDIVAKLLNSFESNNGFYLGLPDKYNYGTDKFAESLALFANGMIGKALTEMRDLNDDYSILPYPKWDENQKDYYTMVDGSHQTMAVPVTVVNTERVGVIVEALCAESYKTVLPSYYEVALKLKGTRDDESIEMLDKIVSSRVFDFGFIFDNWLGASFLMQDLCRERNADFSSYWASKETSVMEHYNTVIEYFETNGK